MSNCVNTLCGIVFSVSDGSVCLLDVHQFVHLPRIVTGCTVKKRKKKSPCFAIMSIFWRNVKIIQDTGNIFSQTTKNTWLGVQWKRSFWKLLASPMTKQVIRKVQPSINKNIFPKHYFKVCMCVCVCVCVCVRACLGVVWIFRHKEAYRIFRYAVQILITWHWNTSNQITKDKFWFQICWQAFFSVFPFVLYCVPSSNTEHHSWTTNWKFWYFQNIFLCVDTKSC